MRRTVRALMAPTMPSAIAWRARSWLVQWVMCSPWAIGSRQASATIWARCRGGNLLGSSQAGLIPKEFRQAASFVAPADTPDGGTVALQTSGYGDAGFACGHGEHDACVVNLKEGQVAAACHSC